MSLPDYQLELLAPARDADIGIKAVNHGADSVYIGGSSFGSRSSADNNQSENLAALVDAGVRSFKIEDRYKDMGYVKNITAHYRTLLDTLLEERQTSAQRFSRASSGVTTFTFTPDPNQNFNREFTDYFVQGRKEDIGAFYAKHGVKVIDAAYESNEELGEVSLCPKQAKGVTGVQGTVKAEPLQLTHGNEKLTLRFDCKPCEMHVMGKMKPSVLKASHIPMTFHKTRPSHG